MANKTKKCTSCKGSGVIKIQKMDGISEGECTSCEGTGVVLFDEAYDDIHNLYIDDEEYFKDE